MIAEKGTMYYLKPVYSSTTDRISLPTCMYQVQNFHGGVIFSDISTTETTKMKNPEVIQQVMRFLQKPLKEFKMIEERQEKLLQQLENLKNQMISMKEKYLTFPSKDISQVPLSRATKILPSLPRDIVINVNPNLIPYYLLYLQKLLNLKISHHVHSSVVTLPSSAADFSKKTSNNSKNVDMNIILIWKEVGVCSQLIASSTMPVVICGDVNILRYLMKAVPNKLTYDDKEHFWEVDSLLDICHKLQCHKTVKDRQALLRQLNSKLGKNQWLNGSCMSVSDLAAWSTIKHGDNSNNLTVSMKSWFDRMENTCMKTVK